MQDASLALPAGQLLALLGPSGCGKTTTLRLIAGLLAPDAGDVRLGDRSLRHLPPERRGLGMVFQRPTLFPHLSVAENVAFGLRVRGLRPREVTRRVAAALEAVQLTGFEARFPQQLSGGQQQRVALARTLITEPRLLLLDEPFSSLDASLREEMRLLLKTLQTRLGVTTVFVTHDQQEALSLADRLGVMMDGNLLQLGTPQEVFERPRVARVARFMGVGNFISGTLRQDHAGRRQLHHAAGRLTLQTPSENVPTPHIGSQVTVMIRPERIGLEAVTSPHDTPNSATPN